MAARSGLFASSFTIKFAERQRTEQKFHNAVEPEGNQEAEMDFGRGVLLYLLGVPLPIILLLALFWHH